MEFSTLPNKNNKFYFPKSITHKDGFIQLTFPPEAFEIESFTDEIGEIIIEDGHFTEADYLFPIKPKFSTPGSIIEISRKKPLINSLPDDSIRKLLGFNSSTLYENCHLRPNPVDILSLIKSFLECDFAQGSLFKGKKISMTRYFPMDVDPGYKYLEKISGGIQWHLMQSFCFKY